MKRPKSKRYKRHKDLVTDQVSNMEKRVHAQLVKDAEERAKDEEFIQKNRLELEIHRRASNASIQM